MPFGGSQSHTISVRTLTNSLPHTNSRNCQEAKQFKKVQELYPEQKGLITESNQLEGRQMSCPAEYLWKQTTDSCPCLLGDGISAN